METIKLLNNEVFDKKDILSKMMDDEFYYGSLNREDNHVPNIYRDYLEQV